MQLARPANDKQESARPRRSWLDLSVRLYYNRPTPAKFSNGSTNCIGGSDYDKQRLSEGSLWIENPNFL